MNVEADAQIMNRKVGNICSQFSRTKFKKLNKMTRQ